MYRRQLVQGSKPEEVGSRPEVVGKLEAVGKLERNKPERSKPVRVRNTDFGNASDVTPNRPRRGRHS